MGALDADDRASVPDATASGLRSALQSTALVVAPTTLLTALLYYFGWASSRTAWMYFGVDQSVIGFSTSDYILRSVRLLFWPLGLIVLGALVALEVDHELELHVRQEGHGLFYSCFPVGLASVGLAMVAAAVLGSLGLGLPLGGPVATPVLFGTGTALLLYASILRRRSLALREGRARPGASAPEGELTPDRRSDHPPSSGGPHTIRFSLAIALLVLSPFWAPGDWASQEGAKSAQALAANLAAVEPGVVIHSKVSLALDGPGVQVDVAKDPSTAYPYTYSGLRLLVRSGGRFFLLPEAWAPHTAPALVVQDDADVRVDYLDP